MPCSICANSCCASSFIVLDVLHGLIFRCPPPLPATTTTTTTTTARVAHGASAQTKGAPSQGCAVQRVHSASKAAR